MVRLVGILGPTGVATILAIQKVFRLGGRAGKRFAIMQAFCFLERIFMCRLTEREQQVISMRNLTWATYKDIAERFGISTERARQVYSRALKKKRILRDIETYCPEFFKVQREMPLEHQHFYRLYSILKEHGLIESGEWARYDDWDWLFVRGIGKKYLRFLNRARELRQLNCPL